MADNDWLEARNWTPAFAEPGAPRAIVDALFKQCRERGGITDSVPSPLQIDFDTWPTFAVWLLTDPKIGIINFTQYKKETQRVADLYIRWRTTTRDEWAAYAAAAYAAAAAAATAATAAYAAAAAAAYAAAYRAQFDKLCALCVPPTAPLKYQPLKYATAQAGSQFAARPCRCGHNRDVHNRIPKGARTTAYLFTRCNYPACDCEQYSPTARVSMKGLHQHGIDCKWDCDEAIIMLATSLLRKIEQRETKKRLDPLEPFDASSTRWNDDRIGKLEDALKKLVPEPDPTEGIAVRKMKFGTAPQGFNE